MNTSDAAAAPRSGMPSWAKKTVWGLALVVLLVLAYFVLAAFLPRWWAQQVGSLAAASMTRGVLWGVTFGVLCTLVPLSLFVAAWRSRKWRYAKVTVIAAVVAAVLVAVPNLLTLSVVAGTGNAAHAGERILDVDAPGFRGATLLGVVVGALIFAALSWLAFRYRRRGTQLSAMRADAKMRADDKMQADGKMQADDRERKRAAGTDREPPA